MSKTPEYDPNDPERESNIFRNQDGSPIEQSTPEQIADELGVTLEEAKKLMGVSDAND